MPKKIYTNTLSVDEAPSDCEVLNLYTRSKKGHFKVPMQKLYESIIDEIRDNYGYFQVRLSVYPLIAVHIYGRKEILARERAFLIERVNAALAEHFDNGLDKIKNRSRIAPSSDATLDQHADG